MYSSWREVTDHGTRICVLLPKLQCQIGHSLCHTFHCHGLIVGEPVILRKETSAGYSCEKIQTEYHVIVAHSICTCVSTLALSIRVLASAIKPLMAQPLRQRGI